MALSRFEAEWNSTTNCRLIFLDLLAHRDLSNEIASRTHVEHQSPQVIVIYQGLPIYNASHNSISAEKIEQLIANLKENEKVYNHRFIDTSGCRNGNRTYAEQ
jgi:hypothetical protein